MEYEALISAKTREEAVEIAKEAMGQQRLVVRAEAIDVSHTEGADTWRVTLFFRDLPKPPRSPSDG